jgi:8-oxo-dGTP diphosphatase
MTTVYTVAFSGTRFLMVYNPRRKGWEMPGGTVELHEKEEEAAVREYLEESGYGITVISSRIMDDCCVFAASLGPRTSEGEFGSRLFDELPDELAFGRSEYDGVIEWARSVAGKSQEQTYPP